MVNWKNISPTEFEELCYLLLEKNDFSNLKWYGKSGSDRGRDILAEKNITPLSNISIHQKWLCQSKRFTEKKISKTELSNILNSAKEHKIDFLLIALTDTLTSDLKDWVEAVKMDYSFKIVLWEELDLRREINKNLKSVSEIFPNLIKQNNVISFYESSPSGKTYFCNEIDEVGFYIMNDYGEEGNIKWIEEFIQFIKSNDISFDRSES